MSLRQITIIIVNYYSETQLYEMLHNIIFIPHCNASFIYVLIKITNLLHIFLSIKFILIYLENLFLYTYNNKNTLYKYLI